MSTRGTKESRPDKPATQVAPETVWVVVKVWKGFSDEVRAFRMEEPAQRQLTIWRKGMNLDEDDADIFEVPIQDAPTQEPRR
jgi:hypothetical protein